MANNGLLHCGKTASPFIVNPVNTSNMWHDIVPALRSA
jgi:hypothetical protein